MTDPILLEGSVLALDLGTKTGWALRTSGGLIRSGVVSFKPSRFAGGGARYLAFSIWLDWLNGLRAAQTDASEPAGPIRAVWFEEVRRHVGTDAAHIYGGMSATLMSWAERQGVLYEGVPVGTIKKHATGRGNASKDEMIAAAKRRGHEPEDDNEADALAILHWALETKLGST